MRPRDRAMVLAPAMLLLVLAGVLRFQSARTDNPGWDPSEGKAPMPGMSTLSPPLAPIDSTTFQVDVADGKVELAPLTASAPVSVITAPRLAREDELSAPERTMTVTLELPSQEGDGPSSEREWTVKVPPGAEDLEVIVTVNGRPAPPV